MDELKLREDHRAKFHSLAAEREKLKIEEHKANFATLPAEE